MYNISFIQGDLCICEVLYLSVHVHIPMYECVCIRNICVCVYTTCKNDTSLSLISVTYVSTFNTKCLLTYICMCVYVFLHIKTCRFLIGKSNGVYLLN